MMSAKKGNSSSKNLINGLKSGLGILLVLTVLYGIYQLVVGMYLAGSFWLIAGILGMIALIGLSEKTVLAGLALYSLFMIAALITHIVYLATFESYSRSNYTARSGDNATVPKMGYQQSRNVWFGSHIAGLIASILGLAVVIPMLLALRREHGHHHQRNKKGSMEQGYGDTSRQYTATPAR
eukprot:NODE_339_length_10647_cov_0.388320.p5 type:complete len:181 gc:universal NODE_339_length_10647_cov_0.388320:6931-6389(-)